MIEETKAALDKQIAAARTSDADLQRLAGEVADANKRIESLVCFDVDVRKMLICVKN